MDNILQSTAPSVEQVMIEPDGTWSKPGEDGNASKRDDSPEGDDDLVEISDERPAVKQEATPVRFSLNRSTPAESREPSSAPSAARSSANKRPASEVIDLTLSDEDEAPRPPPKRPAYQQPNGHTIGYRNYPPGRPYYQGNSSSPAANSCRYEA